MKNYVSGLQENESKLKVKVITSLNKLDTKIQEFLDSKPMEILNVLQSESGGNEEYSVTVTIFYLDYEGGAIFINKDIIYDHVKNSICSTAKKILSDKNFEKFLELIFPRD